MEKLNQETVLVTGGAGYIGSHMTNLLLNSQFNVVALDNLDNGFLEAVPAEADFIQGNIGDYDLVCQIIKEYGIKTIFNFAGYIRVDESQENPEKYYENNVNKTITLLEASVDSKIENFIFSSTAAIFGNPIYTPIDEKHLKQPINVYGKTKLMIEEVLKDFRDSYGLNYGCLRYFNACGSDYKNNLGDRRFPAQHLISIILQNISKRSDEKFFIYGNDWDTKDGTCVRDYIHVLDLCDAHLKLLEYLKNNGPERYFNLGTNVGSSVLDVIKEVQKVTGENIEVNYAPRRQGDPQEVIADGSKAKKLLNWQPKHSSIENIIESAWKWEEIMKKS